MTTAVFIAIILIGLFAGILSGLLGVGGGTVIVPALSLLLLLPQQLAQGIALAVFIPTAALGAYRYYLKDYLDSRIAVYLLAGTLGGVWLGSFLAASISASNLRKIFGVFMISVALTMFRKK